MGQMQQSTNIILCAIDGHIINYYSVVDELPKTLIFEHKQRRKQYGFIEYCYRCTVSDSLHTFFLEFVHKHLIGTEEIACIGKVVEVHKTKNTASISYTEILPD
jgi:hypothetical protein